MTIFEQIKQIPILGVLQHLGLQVSKQDKIMQDGKPTNGWTVNSSEGFVTDFSNNRGKGDQLAFVESYLKISKKEAIEWFKDKYSVTDNNLGNPVYTPPVETKNYTAVAETWSELTELNTKEIEYIEGRGIKYEEVKEFCKSNGGVAVSLKDYNGNVINIKTRLLNGNMRFMQVKGASAKGLYMHKIKRSLKKIVVVEGMFDFLTLRQFFPNVVGLNTKDQGLNVIEEFARDEFEILYITDNDEAGEESAEKMLEIAPNTKIISVSEFGDYKDVSEFYEKTGENPLDIIKKLSKRFEREITKSIRLVSYDDVLNIGEKDLVATDPNKIVKFGYDFLDDNLGGMFGGDLIIVGGISGTGKTTFAMNCGRRLARKGGKVIVLALESTLAKIGKLEILREVNKKRKDKIKAIDWLTGKEKATMAERKQAIDNLKGLNFEFIQADEKISIDDIKNIYKKKADLFIFDHLHYFGIHRGDMSKADAIEQGVQEIKNITTQKGVPTILISHFKKLDEAQKPTMTDFKDSMSIAQTADTIILLWRDKSHDEDDKGKQYVTHFICPKNRVDMPSFTAYGRYHVALNDYVEEKRYNIGTENSEIAQKGNLWNQSKEIFSSNNCNY